MGAGWLSLSVADAGEEFLVSCEGALQEETAGRFGSTTDALLDLMPERIFLDCSEIANVDATGVAAVVHLALSCRLKGIILTASLSEPLRRLVDAAGVDSLISLS